MIKETCTIAFDSDDQRIRLKYDRRDFSYGMCLPILGYAYLYESWDQSFPSSSNPFLSWDLIGSGRNRQTWPRYVGEQHPRLAYEVVPMERPTTTRQATVVPLSLMAQEGIALARKHNTNWMNRLPVWNSTG